MESGFGRSNAGGRYQWRERRPGRARRHPERNLASPTGPKSDRDNECELAPIAAVTDHHDGFDLDHNDSSHYDHDHTGLAGVTSLARYGTKPCNGSEPGVGPDSSEPALAR